MDAFARNDRAQAAQAANQAAPAVGVPVRHAEPAPPAAQHAAQVPPVAQPPAAQPAVQIPPMAQPQQAAPRIANAFSNSFRNWLLAFCRGLEQAISRSWTSSATNSQMQTLPV